MSSLSKTRKNLERSVQGVVATVLSGAATVGLFLVLPLINRIAEGNDKVYELTEVDSQLFENVEEVVEEEEVEEEEPEEEPEPEDIEPEPAEDLTLDSLELMMNAAEGIGAEGIGGTILDFGKLGSEVSDSVDELISASDLDGGRPGVISETEPRLTAAEKKATPGRVVVIYLINPQGRTENVKVQATTNEVLSRAALRAVKGWRYQPPKKDGKPVTVRARKTLEFKDQK